MTDNSHTHQLGTPDDPETYHSETDGSCVVCRADAERDGKCATCYGRGAFYDDDGESFTCYKCKGTGNAPAKAVRA